MRLNDLHWIATAAFGLEGIVAAELKRLGMRDVQAQNGGAVFTGTPSDAFRACLWLRSADRVLLVLADWLIVAVLAGLVPQPHRGGCVDLPVLQVLRHLGEH